MKKEWKQIKEKYVLQTKIFSMKVIKFYDFFEFIFFVDFKQETQITQNMKIQGYNTLNTHTSIIYNGI